MLWKDTLRKFCSHLTTSAVFAEPLKKRRLLSNFFVNDHLLQGVDIDYLALQSLVLVSLTELFSIDVKDIASLIKSWGWFSNVR